ncbi:IS3 family transposase [Corynebacterium tuberculostearicum]|uniref:IS3 family transposase n=1 Tax=Corynebacterium tuberculostearicum TaxID=38304 RepID=UPI0039772902
MQHIGSYDIWARHRGVYGRRKLWKAALREGWAIGRDQVGRLIKNPWHPESTAAHGDPNDAVPSRRPALC